MNANDIHQEVIPVELEDGTPTSVTLAYRDNAQPSPLMLVFPPHPALGGDTQNNVVQALVEAGAARGWLTATFDYRGVQSGTVGEENLMTYWDRLDQSGDYTPVENDTIRIVRVISESFRADPILLFAAYSFGNWVAMRVAQSLRPAAFAGISPPLDEHDFDGLPVCPSPTCLYAAEDDLFCRYDRLADFGRGHRADIRRVEADDHFFRGAEPALARQAVDFLYTAFSWRD